MQILITGGAGFIGSHLCNRLLADGQTVICLDNFFTGQRRNIESLLSNPRFKLVEHDIIEPYAREGEIDQIYNLACPASPVHYQHDPIRTVKANTLGVIHMLDLAHKHGARILQASTSEVYGDPDVNPQPESYRGNVNPIGPRACYDEGKRVAETLCFDYHRIHDLEIRVARIFNTYGPNMAVDDGRVVSNFITQALRGEDITLHGDGSQTRSFCYVDDLVEGLIALMNSQEVGPVNLGNPDHEFTMKELAEKIINLTGSRSKVARVSDFREDDPMQRRPDITLAKTKLGWQPNINLEAGLPKTIEYFNSVL